MRAASDFRLRSNLLDAVPRCGRTPGIVGHQGYPEADSLRADQHIRPPMVRPRFCSSAQCRCRCRAGLSSEQTRTILLWWPFALSHKIIREFGKARDQSVPGSSRLEGATPRSPSFSPGRDHPQSGTPGAGLEPDCLHFGKALPFSYHLRSISINTYHCLRIPISRGCALSSAPAPPRGSIDGDSDYGAICRCARLASSSGLFDRSLTAMLL